jgi:hypothetical protein
VKHDFDRHMARPRTLSTTIALNSVIGGRTLLADQAIDALDELSDRDRQVAASRREDD